MPSIIPMNVLIEQGSFVRGGTAKNPDGMNLMV